MQIKFTFNSTDTITLIPENQKDKDLLKICFSSSRILKTIASPSNSIEHVVLEVNSPDKDAGSYKVSAFDKSNDFSTDLNTGIVYGPR